MARPPTAATRLQNRGARFCLVILPRALSSLPRLLEVFQIRGWLVLLGGHQIAVRAQEIVLLADGDVVIVLGTIVLVPDRIVLAAKLLGHRPRAGQRIVDRGDLVEQRVAG